MAKFCSIFICILICSFGRGNIFTDPYGNLLDSLVHHNAVHITPEALETQRLPQHHLVPYNPPATAHPLK